MRLALQELEQLFDHTMRTMHAATVIRARDNAENAARPMFRVMALHWWTFIDDHPELTISEIRTELAVLVRMATALTHALERAEAIQENTE